MSACPAFDHLLVLPHLRVQNANAVSSPLTHGFPSMTAFLGLMWALERKVRRTGLDLSFKAVAAVCHGHEEQVSDSPFVKTFSLTRNPLGKDGSTAAIVEEGRIHLELTLVFAVRSERWLHQPGTQDADLADVAAILSGMRIAGGTLLPQPSTRRHRPYAIDLTGTADDRRDVFRKARMRWLPGSALVGRDDLLDKRLAELQAENPATTRLDAWLSLSRINWRYRPAMDGTKGEWAHDRTGLGWVVPIPVGYGALSELYPPSQVANARDPATPFRFVESLYSVGEWIGPHRIETPEQMLWYADSRPDDGRYRCCNDYQPGSDPFAALYDFD